MTIDTTLPTSDPMRFRKNFSESPYKVSIYLYSI